MTRLGIFAIALIIFVYAAARSETKSDSITIPLNTIWAYDMPGTREIADIPLPEKDPRVGIIHRDPNHFKQQREFYIEHLRDSLAAKPPDEKARAGFVLPRPADFLALRRASQFVTGEMRQVPQDRKPPKTTIRAGEEITLVFFSHPAAYFANLRGVERKDNKIIVRYQFEPHGTVESTVHFALIPLGKLPSGEYFVDYEQVPIEQEYVDAGFKPVSKEATEIVSQPFSFSVWEPAEPASPAKDSLIPMDRAWGYDMPGMKDVRDLEPKLDPTLPRDEIYRRYDVRKILKSLRTRPNEGKRAGPAFVVVGNGKQALENAAAVFSNGEDAPNVVPPDTDLSLVFYSHMCGRYVRLKSIENVGKQITLQYQFVTHSNTSMTTHFALIPLGKLVEGEYQVKIEQLEPIGDTGQPVPLLQNPERLVCNSFSFTVRKN